MEPEIPRISAFEPYENQEMSPVSPITPTLAFGNESAKSSREKRSSEENRLRREFLLQCYAKNPNPTASERRIMLEQLKRDIPNHNDYKESSISQWFVNHRRKGKHNDFAPAQLQQSILSPDKAAALQTLYSVSTPTDEAIRAWATVLAVPVEAVLLWVAEKQASERRLPTPSHSTTSPEPRSISALAGPGPSTEASRRMSLDSMPDTPTIYKSDPLLSPTLPPPTFNPTKNQASPRHQPPTPVSPHEVISLPTPLPSDTDLRPPPFSEPVKQSEQSVSHPAVRRPEPGAWLRDLVEEAMAMADEEPPPMKTLSEFSTATFAPIRNLSLWHSRGNVLPPDI